MKWAVVVAVLACVQMYGCAARATEEAEHDTGNEVEDGCRMKVCRFIETQECGLCHSIFMKECHIEMEYSYKPIKINDCKESICDATGYTRECRTKYYTECNTDMVYHNMEEDYPVCGVVKQEKCSDTGCNMIPVMKCKIEKRTIRKAKPESKCKRVPARICRKKKCQKKRCFERVVMSKEMLPQEKCEYKEKRVCQEVEGSTCRPVSRQECDYHYTGKPCQHDEMMKHGGLQVEAP